MHWLSDVIGGFALGTAYLLIAIATTQTLFGRAVPRPAVAVAQSVEASPPA
jgi:membrane-associated phospholipid phosphatase